MQVQTTWLVMQSVVYINYGMHCKYNIQNKHCIGTILNSFERFTPYSSSYNGWRKQCRSCNSFNFVFVIYLWKLKTVMLLLLTFCIEFSIYMIFIDNRFWCLNIYFIWLETITICIYSFHQLKTGPQKIVTIENKNSLLLNWYITEKE